MRSLGRLALFLVGLAGVLPALAHHGRDFLFSQSADQPHPGDVYLLPRQDYLDAEEGSEIELEPTLLFGLFPRLSAEIHAHVAKEEGESLTYESTAAAAHFRLTPAESRIGMAATGEFELARDDAEPDRGELRLAASSAWGRSLLAANLVAERFLPAPILK